MLRRLAQCPSCRHNGEFEYTGAQHWPPDMAQKLDLPATTHLWTCVGCGTTLSDQELLPYRDERRMEAIVEITAHS